MCNDTTCVVCIVIYCICICCRLGGEEEKKADNTTPITQIMEKGDPKEVNEDDKKAT